MTTVSDLVRGNRFYNWQKKFSVVGTIASLLITLVTVGIFLLAGLSANLVELAKRSTLLFVGELTFFASLVFFLFLLVDLILTIRNFQLPLHVKRLVKIGLIFLLSSEVFLLGIFGSGMEKVFVALSALVILAPVSMFVGFYLFSKKRAVKEAVTLIYLVIGLFTANLILLQAVFPVPIVVPLITGFVAILVLLLLFKFIPQLPETKTFLFSKIMLLSIMISSFSIGFILYFLYGIAPIIQGKSGANLASFLSYEGLLGLLLFLPLLASLIMIIFKIKKSVLIENLALSAVWGGIVLVETALWGSSPSFLLFNSIFFLLTNISLFVLSIRVS